MSRLLIFAHPLEAQASIEVLNAEKESPGIYRFEGGQLLVCGIGPIQAAAATANHLRDHDEVWNLGCAGSLGKLKLNQVVEAGSVGQRFFPDCSERARTFAEEHQPTIILGEGPRLLTTNTPIDQPGLATRGDLVDMEGYGVALAAKLARKPVRLIKIISDLASGEQEISSRLEECGELLAAKLMSF